MNIYSINTNLIHFLSSGQLASPCGFTYNHNNFKENVLILVTEGTLFITSNNVEHAISAGEFILLPAAQTHFGTKPSLEKIAHYWIHFSGALNNENNYTESNSSNIIYLPEKGSFDIAGCDVSIYKKLSEIALNNGKISKTKPDANKNHINKKTNDHIIRLSKIGLSKFLLHIYAIGSANIYVNYKPIVSKIIDWIETNYTSTITVNDLAKKFGYHPRYLSTIFKKSIGTTITDYVNYIRINASKVMLTNHNIPIKEIAFSCGYNDEKYFIRVFRRHAGTTPRDFRQNFNHIDPVPSNQEK